MSEIIESEEKMWAYAEHLIPQIQDLSMIGLKGNLGAGKTTLVRGIIRALGYNGTVKSPTYGLVETYDIGERTIAHFDLYRLGEPDELEFIGFSDFTKAGNLCLIEWPEKGGKWTSKLDIVIEIDHLENGRKISISRDLHQQDHN